MELILSGGIIILGICFVVERRRRISLKKELNYITSKLNELMQQDAMERIKQSTLDKEMRAHISIINDLLDFNHKNLVKYNKARISMKKMLSNVSHDLKTPLTVVLGYLELLEMKYKEDEMVHKTYQKVQEVLELINKFFDLAKLESGDKEIQLEKVDLSEVCRMTILDYYNTLRSEAFDVDIRVPEESVFILGNRNALNRILNNLISNALKYGAAGKYLGLYLKEEKESVVIEVIDRGKGIAEQYKEEVFERVYTLEDSRSKTYQGSGLGLTITKELVETLGGEIHLESVPYKKTVFSCKFNKLSC